MKHVIPKLVNGIALGTATYLAVSCPCDVYLECKRPYYLALLAIGAAFAVAGLKE